MRAPQALPRRRPTRLLGLLLAATLAPAAATEPGAYALDALLARLARPLPAATPFVEVRTSGLLDAPIPVRGQLLQPDADTLVREVDSPWRERSVIRAERVTVAREGERERRFALRRAPELGALLASFPALLAGDRVRLEQHYAVTLDEDGQVWSLTLVPRDPRLRERVAGIELRGLGDAPACLQLRQADGGGSRTLLGEAALAELPDFDAHCGPALP